MKLPTFHLAVAQAILAIFLPSAPFAHAGEEDFYKLQQKMEEDVLALRKVAEEAYLGRCDTETLQRCYMGNYDACHSTYPSAECFVGEEFQFDGCTGTDSSCTLWDYTVSNVRLPPSLSETPDQAVIESICFSQAMDDYFVQKTEADKSFWQDNYDIYPPWMHFGSSSGAFRIYPARPQEDCPSNFDPRLRPWYVAGSSGPKNIVLILDTSGSMNGLRMEYMKDAAIRVIDTLTIGDRVAVVPFSTDAQEIVIDNRSLVKVNENTKNDLKRAIQELEARGSTNFYEAFTRAFALMSEAIPTELIVDCNTAILFLTDGKMTDPAGMTEPVVLDYIRQGLEELEAKLAHPVHLFTYSISENDDVHAFPKQLACSATSRGVWSKIVDDSNIVESLSSYYKLFSMGLGEGKNDDFTAWAEPYIFSTNGMLGVTVSAPVFDRSVNPPVLVGVVGLDFPMSALDKALGVPLGSSQTMERVVLSSTAKCPRLETTTCQLESFRAFGIAGSEALCGAANCTSSGGYVSIEAEVCRNHDDLPVEFLAKKDVENTRFEDKFCCRTEQCGSANIEEDGLGKGTFDDEAANVVLVEDGSDGLNPLLIAVIALLGVIVLGFIGYLSHWRRRQRLNVQNQQSNNELPKAQVFSGVYVMPPPNDSKVEYPSALATEVRSGTFPSAPIVDIET